MPLNKEEQCIPILMETMQKLLQQLDQTYGTDIAEPIKWSAQQLHQDIKECNFQQWLTRPLDDHFNEQYGMN